MMTLDFAIFGSGRGLGMPAWDQRLYWMVDTNTNCGTFYTYMAGFGAQLHSFQWTHPRAQERRMLAGVEFKPFNSHRRYGRVCVSWACVRDIRQDSDFRRLEERLGVTQYDRWSPISATDGTS